MNAGETITFLLLVTGATCAARPVSDLVNRIVTKSRGRREVGIRLPSDDDGPNTKPFSRFELVALSVAGLFAEAVGASWSRLDRDWLADVRSHVAVVTSGRDRSPYALLASHRRIAHLAVHSDRLYCCLCQLTAIYPHYP